MAQLSTVSPQSASPSPWHRSPDLCPQRGFPGPFDIAEEFLAEEPMSRCAPRVPTSRLLDSRLPDFRLSNSPTPIPKNLATQFPLPPTTCRPNAPQPLRPHAKLETKDATHNHEPRTPGRHSRTPQRPRHRRRLLIHLRPGLRLRPLRSLQPNLRPQ